ncbi:MAG: nucleotide sugar dehydrogenase [Porphyromonadaceae bacterium]|nr:MAG: nucleotide sugar dehydrogenase [Porphyromonadaceae bacterium]
MINDLLNRKASLAVIGLGYVGLPLVLAFGKKMLVTGYDVNPERVARLRQGIDPSGESAPEKFLGIQAGFTHLPDSLKSARVFIIAVPTPVDDHNVPQLDALMSATETVGKSLKNGDLVIYESTVYPGCTEEECIPVLERVSGLKYLVDFKVGFSPERINPGDQVHQLENTVKITAGCDEESSEIITSLYSLIVNAGVHPVSSIKVAETAKIIENTQRDLNIALMNELSIICNKMGVNTYEAIEAAGTKWNFLKFSPGLVGGHCIGVDPYYLTYKARKLGYHPHVILAGRYVNDSMGFYVAKQTVKRILAKGLDIRQSKILVLGFTFKEDISDIRNTRVADLVRELQSYQAAVTVTDPHADPAVVKREYGIDMASPESGYDAVIVAVAHREYLEFTAADFEKWLKPGGIVVDVKGIYRGQVGDLEYFSL